VEKITTKVNGIKNSFVLVNRRDSVYQAKNARKLLTLELINEAESLRHSCLKPTVETITYK
jgi:hypothetical protein